MKLHAESFGPVRDFGRVLTVHWRCCKRPVVRKAEVQATRDSNKIDDLETKVNKEKKKLEKATHNIKGYTINTGYLRSSILLRLRQF